MTSPPRWIPSDHDHLGNPRQFRIKIGKSDITIFAGPSVVSQKAKEWSCHEDITGSFFPLEDATTPEQTIAEAVVAITQRLAQLSADLRSIPLTFQP